MAPIFLIIPLFELLSENPSDVLKLELRNDPDLMPEDTGGSGLYHLYSQASTTVAPSPGHALSGANYWVCSIMRSILWSARYEELRSEVGHTFKD